MDEMGRVSGNGWAFGSIGGIVCLLFILPPIVISKSNVLVVRGSFVFTAIFFALATIPLFLWVKETRAPKSLPAGEDYFSVAFKRLASTFKSVRHFREYIQFIVSFLIYNDGILMALGFASIIGRVLFGMNQTQLIIFMIIVQLTSSLGAYVFGIWGGKYGYKRSLNWSILLMIAAVVGMIFNPSLTGYYFIGALAGFALTGVQSLSRTMAGLFAPESKSTEFFSFFAVAGKSSSFIGPTIYGLIAYSAAKYFTQQGVGATLAEQYGQRASIGTIAIFLIVGFIILSFVNEARARKAAVEYAATD
jgi:UMF1 family MFS transporter